jgi:predicted DNA-binding protein
MADKEGFIGIRLSATLKLILQSMADREGRTLSNYIERLLERHIVDTQQSGILSVLVRNQQTNEDDSARMMKYIDSLLEKHLTPEDLTDLLQAKAMLQAESAKPKKK